MKRPVPLKDRKKTQRGKLSKTQKFVFRSKEIIQEFC